MGKQTFESVETVTRRELADLRQIPKESVVRLEREMTGEGMWSAARERFTVAGLETTPWESETSISSATSRCESCGV